MVRQQTSRKPVHMPNTVPAMMFWKGGGGWLDFKNVGYRFLKSPSLPANPIP